MTLPTNFWDTPIAAPRQERIRLHIVSDEYCPSCREPGSPKVWDADETCWWKCLSPWEDCKIGYWVPGSRRIEKKLPPDQAAAQAKRIRDQITKQMKDRIWITRGHTSTTIHKDEAIPAGWHLTGKGDDD